MTGVSSTTTTRMSSSRPYSRSGRSDPIRDPATERAPDGHPAEEPGQDRRDRLGRVAEDQHQLARPDDLVDQPGGAGQDEDVEDDAANEFGSWIHGRRIARHGTNLPANIAVLKTRSNAPDTSGQPNRNQDDRRPARIHA